MSLFKAEIYHGLDAQVESVEYVDEKDSGFSKASEQ